MSARAVVGIDLGTTHCALARAELDAEGAVAKKVELLQLVGPSSLERRDLLPSFLYFGTPNEGALPLPWDEERTFAVGEFARARGVEAPGRVIASAKSWLCHPGVDRRSGLLPQGAPEDIETISPVEASYRYLDHLSEAYAHAFPGESLGDQDIVLTVPASFDAAARDLTVEAALAAGLENLTLLEEPQAALYSWIASRHGTFRSDLRVGDVIVVIDVGGGTTDFSAIAVGEAEGSFELTRIAVGDHILLGGDNMDLALAHIARQKLVAAGKEIDRMQLAGLTYAARTAKERLLADPSLATAPIALAARGSQLVGGSLRADVTQEEIERTLIEGFFPVVAKSARPVSRARAGLTQLGLPYAQDPAVTRQLAGFLARQAGAGGQTGSMLHPTAILFNGGVMKSARLQKRLVDVLGTWMDEEGHPKPRVLEGADLDLGVAIGAAHYGLVRKGKGLRIRGGTARAYYVGIESAVPAVPGIEPPIVAMCVAPFGMEEGSAPTEFPEELGVVVGEPVRFRFFGSSVRREDTPGLQLESWKESEIEELPPIEITLPAVGRQEGDVVPIKLAASVTDVGTLLLEAVPTEPVKDDERWKIELSVRAEQPAE
ncbi:MAG: Hsp70 family protein [Polyangiaceae bacterium]|nr:Hsp70 family protein [Polyangiaceae bacterium]